MAKLSPIVQRVDDLIRPAIESLGFDLVRVRLQGGTGRQVLQIMAEPADKTREMTVEDCAQVSRHISAILDVEDPISSAYNLEVSSPGIDRPLNTAAEFTRYIGHEAMIEMEWPVEGRKRFRGQILSVDGDNVRLKLDEVNEATLGVEGMQSAKLALTDSLIKEHQKRFAASKEGPMRAGMEMEHNLDNDN